MKDKRRNQWSDDQKDWQKITCQPLLFFLSRCWYRIQFYHYYYFHFIISSDDDDNDIFFSSASSSCYSNSLLSFFSNFDLISILILESISIISSLMIGNRTRLFCSISLLLFFFRWLHEKSKAYLYPCTNRLSHDNNDNNNEHNEKH